MIHPGIFTFTKDHLHPTTLEIIIAIFFIAHGFIHTSLSWVPLPKPDHANPFPIKLDPERGFINLVYIQTWFE